jgi:hypothetical protein
MWVKNVDMARFFALRRVSSRPRFEGDQVFVNSAHLALYLGV